MIIATAGHVDHGKTSLVRALTGVDTDRLPEEKQRGMSIDLGFAYWTTESGVTLAFVDVPGHERFIRNMMAGMSGVQLGLLVVAADDGPMPQTREHLQILALAGVPRLLVVLTKIDLVDAERLAQVQKEMQCLLADSPWDAPECIALSNRTGAGMDLLRSRLQVLATDELASRGQSTPGGADDACFRLHIDRAFTLKGAGLVVTGTVVSGAVRADDTVMLLPGSRTARVRSVHADGRPSQSACAGQRCALNLAGLELASSGMERGQQLIAPAQWPGSTVIDLRLSLASSPPALRWPMSVTACIGAGSAPARLSRLGEADAPDLVRLTFEQEMHCFVGDRILLRDAGSGLLIGAGIVLDPLPPLRRPRLPNRISALSAICPGDVRATLAGLLELGRPVALEWLWRAFQLGSNWSPHLGDLDARLIQTQGGLVALSKIRCRELCTMVVEALTEAHRQRPELAGLRLAELLSPVDRELHGVMPVLLLQLQEEGVLARHRQYLRLAGHRPVMRPEDAALFRRMMPLFSAAGVRAPRVVELAESLGMERAPLEASLKRMAMAECLLQVAKNRYYLPTVLARLARQCEELATSSPSKQFVAADFRDASGLGRNLTIEVLEFFDRAGLTRREGEARVMTADASLFDDAGNEQGRDTLPVERAGFKPDGRCTASLGSSTLSSSAT